MSRLEVEGLKKSFGATELFHDVNFRIAKGERAGLVGANGAGKTTLLRCLLGEEECDAGRIRFDIPATVGYAKQQATLGTGTLYEEFRAAFADIERLEERKRTLEKTIADGADEAAMAEYSRVVERFELVDVDDADPSPAWTDRAPWPVPFCPVLLPDAVEPEAPFVPVPPPVPNWVPCVEPASALRPPLVPIAPAAPSEPEPGVEPAWPEPPMLEPEPCSPALPPSAPDS